jgi:oligoendopeptidase F
MSNTVIEGFLINELEKWAYTQDMTKYAVDGGALQFEKDLRKAWSDVCTERNLKSYDTDKIFNSWVELVLLNYQGYYISYSTSAIAALEVYAKAVEDWALGVEDYKKLYAPHEATDTFSSVLVDSGYYSIFDENAYKAIAAACGVLSDSGLEE